MLNMPKGYNLGHMQLIPKGHPGFKFPMLIVGANTWIQQKINNEVLKGYDCHLLFFPNINNVWCVGCVMMNRLDSHTPLSYYTEDNDIQRAFKKLFHLINGSKNNNIEIEEKKLVWLTNSIYRCAKIPIKDVLHLVPYKEAA